MAKKTFVGNIDRVSLPGKGPSSSGRTMDPSKSSGGEQEEGQGQGQGQNEPQSSGETGTEETGMKKPSPGKRSLSPEEILDDEFLEQIEKGLKSDEWNVGGVPTPGEGEAGAGGEGEGGDSPVSMGNVPSEYEDRIWGDPSKLEKTVDDAIKQGLENERQDDEQKAKEGKTVAEKARGKGGTTVRDRIEIEVLSQTDWAAIFRNRLTAYSNEKAQYLPYNRRFVAGRRVPTGRLPDQTKNKDVLPELNVIIDTSSSLSYKELEVILAELEKALSSAKIKSVNVILWASTAYFGKTYKDITSKNFNVIIDDINNNWKGGGNSDVSYLQKMIDMGIEKNFTINLTDGWIDDYTTPGSKTYELATKVFDPKNLIWGIIFNSKQVSMDTWNKFVDKFPGQKIPIFLETKKFGQ
jgi:hypothetical protein